MNPSKGKRKMQRLPKAILFIPLGGRNLRGFKKSRFKLLLEMADAIPMRSRNSGHRMNQVLIHRFGRIICYGYRGDRFSEYGGGLDELKFPPMR